MHVTILGSPAFDSLEYHLSDACQALGHTTRIIDPAAGMIAPAKLTYWVARFSDAYDRFVAERAASRIVANRPDLVLVVYRTMHPVLVDQLKQHLPGVPIVQINPDALTNLEKQQIIASDYDYYFSKEPYLVDTLRDKAGLPAYYLPEGFNPRVHRKPAIDKVTAERDANIDVLVYGGLYAYRARMIEQLIQVGISVVVFGKEGPYLNATVKAAFRGRYLVGEEKNRLLYGARIVFNNLHYAEVTSANQKYFEINGIGAFQLCDYKPTLDEYSGVPTEEVTFRTMADAIDKIRYYLARPDERYALAETQHQHFLKHHTIDQRVRQVLHITGLQPFLSTAYETLGS
jgi:spore maturation protein CgeB